MYNKKGQSLVEVVVATSILILVLSSVVTLIVNVLNLTLMSRNSLAATTFAQKLLTEEIAKDKNTCSVPASIDIEPTYIEDATSGFGYYIWKTSPQPGVDEGFYSNDPEAPEGNYLKYIVSVRFKNKGYGDSYITAAEIVRKN